MSRRPDVQWTEVAVGDLEESVAFVAADDPAAADELERDILSATEQLASHPARGRVVPELLRLGVRAYRELVVTPYRVVYRATPRRVYVIAVIHGARDLGAVLLRRVTRP